MNLPTMTPAMPYYPVVANALIDDPTPKDQAIYIPSVSPTYAMAAHAKAWKRPLPKGVGEGDLNFLDPQNPLMRMSHVMSSAGQALNQPRDCIITTRDRRSTLVVGDSGGYQIATGKLRITGDADRLKILRWLEANADVAMTLDVPTAPVGSSGYPYATSKACLAATLENLRFFRAHRKSDKVRFLNVMQGNNQREADGWYDAVKGFEFEGWALAGVLRHNFYHVLRRILIMAGDNQLQNKSWIHILGTNQLDTAICLTALQRAINRHINPNLRISYDTSSPFRNLAWNNTYSVPRFDRSSMVMPTERIPDGVEFVNAQIRWPWPSPLGDRMVMGDVCVKNDPYAASQRDVQSSLYIAHHNLSALCSAITLANRVFDSESIGHKHTIGLSVGAAVEAIENIMASGSMTALAKYRSTLERVRHDKVGATDDEDRELMD
jgi:hypothetical protein